MAEPTASDEPASGADAAEWRARAGRLAPLVDGVEYFRAVREACIRARRQILIVGWEIHSEIDLLRGEEADHAAEHERWPIRLAALLRALVEEREELEVRLLIWEGASLFALERQHLPRMKRPWDKHPRITLVWDEDTPRLASHHQKVVVVDDRVAFAGGMDLTKARWDRHDHDPDDPRRRKPGLLPFYGKPYHDLMLAVDGPAAVALGDWCRTRWRRATGEDVDPPPSVDAEDPWPTGVEPLLTDRDVSVALTEPEHNGRAEKRQVEESYVEQIRRARGLIFIETQYFAAGRIADALRERLADPDGPEIVLILPYGCPDKIQSMAMDTRRDELLDSLRDADPGGRLGVYWATLAGGDTEDVFERSVYIHAKTMIVDDRLLRIGSANLNRRSMGLDTELDLFCEVGDGETDARGRIAAFRRRLLAYLLHAEPETIRRAEEDEGSLVAAIESLRGGERTLHPFDHRAPEPFRAIRPDPDLTDPDRPLSDIDAEKALEIITRQVTVPDRLRKAYADAVGLVRRWKWPALILLLAGLLVALWSFTPLRDLADRQRIEMLVEDASASPAGLAGVAAGFIVLGSVGFPITVLIAAVGAMVGLWGALAVCVIGCVGASLAGFAAGRLAHGGMRRRLQGGRMRALVSVLRGRGLLTVAVTRNLPIAPFAVVNAAFGFSGVSWRDYLLGTLIGMLPGIVLLTVFGNELGEMIANPTPGHIATVLGAGAAVVVAALIARRLLRRYAPDPDEAGEPDGAEES